MSVIRTLLHSQVNQFAASSFIEKKTMDLSNLLSNLPPTKPVNQQSVDETHKEITEQFKTSAKEITNLYNLKLKDSNHNQLNQTFAKAAKSVASLYRVSNTSSGLNHYNGYLNCLNDLLNVISEGGDIENWALIKKAEITKRPDDQCSQEIPQAKEFCFDPEFSINHHFKQGYPPLSVCHGPRQRANWKQLKREKEKEKEKLDKCERIEDNEERKRKAKPLERKRKEQKKN